MIDWRDTYVAGELVEIKNVFAAEAQPWTLGRILGLERGFGDGLNCELYVLSEKRKTKYHLRDQMHAAKWLRHIGE